MLNGLRKVLEQELRAVARLFSAHVSYNRILGAILVDATFRNIQSSVE